MGSTGRPEIWQQKKSNDPSGVTLSGLATQAFSSLEIYISLLSLMTLELVNLKSCVHPEKRSFIANDYLSFPLHPAPLACFINDLEGSSLGLGGSFHLRVFTRLQRCASCEGNHFEIWIAVCLCRWGGHYFISHSISLSMVALRG